jgi:hypothetical protein
MGSQERGAAVRRKFVLDTEGHTMSLSAGCKGSYANGWNCDRCAVHGTGIRYFCEPCGADYCIDCGIHYRGGTQLCVDAEEDLEECNAWIIHLLQKLHNHTIDSAQRKENTWVLRNAVQVLDSPYASVKMKLIAQQSQAQVKMATVKTKRAKSLVESERKNASELERTQAMLQRTQERARNMETKLDQTRAALESMQMRLDTAVNEKAKERRRNRCLEAEVKLLEAKVREARFNQAHEQTHTPIPKKMTARVSTQPPRRRKRRVQTKRSQGGAAGSQKVQQRKGCSREGGEEDGDYDDEFDNVSEESVQQRNQSPGGGGGIEVGTKVEARWQGGDEWFPGVVVSVKHDAQRHELFDVVFDDGDSEDGLPQASVRPLALTVNGSASSAEAAEARQLEILEQLERQLAEVDKEQEEREKREEQERAEQERKEEQQREQVAQERDDSEQGQTRQGLTEADLDRLNGSNLVHYR